ncbi:MAG TPA: hypothetical protein VI914_04355 [Thermodesulfobacteriota bacterium]|nr:hypothetical protein [Thermodesulfobacteriota bacterium]
MPEKLPEGFHAPLNLDNNFLRWYLFKKKVSNQPEFKEDTLSGENEACRLYNAISYKSLLERARAMQRPTFQREDVMT